MNKKKIEKTVHTQIVEEKSEDFLSMKPEFEKVNAFLNRPIEISEKFLRESGRLDENIVIVNTKNPK